MGTAITRNEAVEWITDAIADGWVHVEDWKKQSTTLDKLNKGEWVVHIYNYSQGSLLEVWKANGCHAIQDPPKKYYMKSLIALGNQCHFCGRNESLQRVGFASAACQMCYTSAKKKLEFPGWCD